MKIVTKVNGKDVLWSNFTLRFTHFGKLLQSYKAAAKELFREERWNELQSDLREMMRLVEP